ncbi:MAG: type II toxin-antitoxin system VapC family toxin [Saprospiraceae bacterium]|nr:type II toxin-antitoxin system VapC family toxin [Saprospiraceae bacterium]
MEQYLIDTDICIFFLQGKFGIKDKVKEVGIDNCYISEITIAELTFGAYYSSNFEKHIVEIKQIEDLFQVIPIYDAVPLYGKEKARLKKAGLLIPDFDLLIGTTAIAKNMIMATNNENHLSRIAGVKIENWTTSMFNNFV